MVQRWQFYDPATTDTWTMPANPSEMSPVHERRSIEVMATTAVDGQVLLREGSRVPAEFSFSGKTLNYTHYETLRSWVYDRPNRIQITDHFGRPLTVVLRDFKATPNRARNRYWYHQYEVTGVILDVGAATVELA